MQKFALRVRGVIAPAPQGVLRSNGVLYGLLIRGDWNRQEIPQLLSSGAIGQGNIGVRAVIRRKDPRGLPPNRHRPHA